jgi:large subunit ribosomal protein L31
MKPGIHPEVFEVDATCVCGNVLPVTSTSKVVKMDICSACHPFFTGQQKIIDTEGRVERFNRKYEMAAKLQEEKAKKKQQA